MDEAIDAFNILVIDGSSVSKFDFKIEVGIGSRLQCLLFVLIITFLTSSVSR